MNRDSLKTNKVDSLENYEMSSLADSKFSLAKNAIYHEARTWKVARGLIEDGLCRVCHGHDETMEHLVVGCSVLTSEYLTRHNRALMILSVTRVKEHKLIGADTLWYKERWEPGMVLENDKAKLAWDFQFNLRKP